MRQTAIFLIAGASSLYAAPSAMAQSSARQSALSETEALQLTGEAGFAVQDGIPVNRCGRASNPRIFFVDLNGDGAAEAHAADVDPQCYGKPGAYFAILTRGADGKWRRLIAEDGIVGFEPSRTGGWNDLALDVRYSDCPGMRRFDGTDYGAPTACAPLAMAGVASSIEREVATGAPAPTSPLARESSGVEQAAGSGSALTGSRVNQLAQLLRNIVPASQARSWEVAQAAFPGANWQPQETHAAWTNGSTLSQYGTIDLGGAVYRLSLSGTPAAINAIGVSGPDDDNLDWSLVENALRTNGVIAQAIGCSSPTGFGFVRLTSGRESAIVHKFLNYGNLVPSTDEYSFMLDDPFDGRGTEAEVARDTSLC